MGSCECEAMADWHNEDGGEDGIMVGLGFKADPKDKSDPPAKKRNLAYSSIDAQLGDLLGETSSGCPNAMKRQRKPKPTPAPQCIAQRYEDADVMINLEEDVHSKQLSLAPMGRRRTESS